MSTFKALRIFNDNDRIAGRVVDATLEELAAGEVVFSTAYSSVNYKDALAGTGAGGRIIRKYPLIGGIDAAGTVVSSSDDGVGVCDERISTAVPVLSRLTVTSPRVVGCGNCSMSPTPFLKFGNGTGSV